MYLLIVFIPLIGSVLSGFLGRFLGQKGAPIITLLCVVSSFLISCLAFYEVGLSGSPCYIDLINWIQSELLVIRWGFLFDSLTVTILIVVTSVSTLVHLYSSEYIKEDPHLARFISYLSLFTFFILILVTGDNIVQLFVGWEGVGLCSYLLINFWFGRIQANKAAIKAIIVNRIGDFGLTIGILSLFFIFKALDFSTIFISVEFANTVYFSLFGFEIHALSFICFILFIGAIGKSAQLGLHTWLPDAIEGPTPVSALIHAATIVTAGVFIILRCSPLLEYCPDVLIFITFIGALTAFFAATSGLLQNDLKRVIAYSTCSQLGYIVFVAGLSSYSTSLFHLSNHAFFKALLFLSAGSVIHAIIDEQDIRKIGGLVNLLPITYVIVLIGSLALIGFPFLTGFYSKDVILELAYASYRIDGSFAHWLGSLSAFFTAFYSFRLLWLTFLNEPNGAKVNYNAAHDAPWKIIIPLIVLAFGSIFVGYLGKDIIIGLGTDFWQNAIYVHPNNSLIYDSEFLDATIKIIPLFFSLGGTFAALFLYKFGWSIILNLQKTFVGYKLFSFFNKKWYFDKVYTDLVALPLLNIGYNITLKVLDRGVIEIFGPYGLSTNVLNVSRGLRKLQTGFVYHYALAIVIIVVFIIILFYSKSL